MMAIARRAWIALTVGATAAQWACRPHPQDTQAPGEEVMAPDGDPAIYLQCAATTDCMNQAATRCPDGYEVVDRRELGSTSKAGAACVPVGDTVICGGRAAEERHQEMVVKCKAGAQPAAPPEESDGEVPEGAVGFAFGISADDAGAVCSKAGHSWDEALTTCSALPSPVGFEGIARAGFCEARLCRVELVFPTDPAEMMGVLAKLRVALGERYGRPTRSKVQVPQECRKRSTFASCLARGEAVIEVLWSWSDKHAVFLTAEAAESPTVHIHYFNPVAVRAMRASGL